MSIKRYDITIPKEDYQTISILTNKKLGDNDLMFMTVKRTADSDNIIFQKSFENGISYNSETLKYEIEITSEDTKNLVMGNKYGYDIVIYYEGNKPKQKVIGELTIGQKYTLNEVI